MWVKVLHQLEPNSVKDFVSVHVQRLNLNEKPEFSNHNFQVKMLRGFRLSYAHIMTSNLTNTID